MALAYAGGLQGQSLHLGLAILLKVRLGHHTCPLNQEVGVVVTAAVKLLAHQVAGEVDLDGVVAHADGIGFDLESASEELLVESLTQF